MLTNVQSPPIDSANITDDEDDDDGDELNTQEEEVLEF